MVPDRAQNRRDNKPVFHQFDDEKPSGVAERKYVVVVERCKDKKDTPYRKDLKQRYGRVPFVAEQRVEKRCSRYSHSDHHGENYKSREAMDLTHVIMEFVTVVLHFCQNRHEGGCEHLRDRCAPHLAPFVGLGIDSE